MGRALVPSWGAVPVVAAAGSRRSPPRLDHLLVGPAVEVVAVRDLDPVGSDHRPFVADLGLAD